MDEVIIIGSGLGGLLCGEILSRNGMGVTILEKEPKAGGNLSTFTRHCRKFETGVHYIGAMAEGEALNRYWNYFGLNDGIQYKMLDGEGFDRIIFNDHEFPLAGGLDNFRDRLLSLFPYASASLDAYISKLREIADASPMYNPGNEIAGNYGTGMDQGIENYLHSIGSMHRFKGTGISLADVLAGNNFLYGADPETPLRMAAMINHSYLSGACRVVGGSDMIARKLVLNIADRGGRILTRSYVKEIVKTGKGFKVKTEQDGEFYGKRVISAIHPASAVRMIDPSRWRPASRNRILKLQQTKAPFILYLSLTPGKVRYLNYNIYYHSSTDPWIRENEPEKPWPSMFLLSMGCDAPDQLTVDSATVMTTMDYSEVFPWEGTRSGQRGQDYESFKSEMAGRLMELLTRQFPEITAAIEHVDAATPLTHRDFTGAPEGSLYGIRKSFLDPVATTILPATRIPGFYFTGQNVNTHGVVGVTIGAVMTCGEILGREFLLSQIKNA